MNKCKITNECKIVMDERGVFAELLKNRKDNWQTSYIEIYPFHTRGSHYHKRKMEIFILLDGECTLLLDNKYIKMERFKKYEIRPNLMHVLINDNMGKA